MLGLRIITGLLVRTVNRRTVCLSPTGLCCTRSASVGSSSSSLSSFDDSPTSNNRRRNKEALFMDSKVQTILKKITGYDEERIFSNRPVSGYKPPKYLFLTDEELNVTRERARMEGAKSLQMPPVMEPWENNDYIISDEPEFQGFDNCNLVITDLSQGFSDRSRLIAVREPNGMLRRARWEERYRANQVYFPVPGREVTVPKMFEPEHLEPILDRHDYLFVLDRACIQFEPDDPRYIKIVQKTYDHINNCKKFDILRSTRHFGPMAFYLVFEGKIDSLLQDMINRELIENSVNLINLYYIVNPSEQRRPIDFSSTDNISIIKSYLMADCKEKYLVEKSLRTYEEIVAARNENESRMSEHG